MRLRKLKDRPLVNHRQMETRPRKPRNKHNLVQVMQLKQPHRQQLNRQRVKTQAAAVMGRLMAKPHLIAAVRWKPSAR